MIVSEDQLQSIKYQEKRSRLITVTLSSVLIIISAVTACGTALLLASSWLTI